MVSIGCLFWLLVLVLVEGDGDGVVGSDLMIPMSDLGIYL